MAKRLSIIVCILLLAAPAAHALPWSIKQVYECAMWPQDSDPICEIPNEKRPYQLGARPLCKAECQYNILSSIRYAKNKVVFKDNIYEWKEIKICIPASTTDQDVANKFSEWYQSNEKETELNFDREIGRIAEELYPCSSYVDDDEG